MLDSSPSDTASSVTVSAFRLDRFEVTVGRFRAFVNAYPGSKPKPGDGSHPLISGSGWDASWPLPADQAALKAALKCDPQQTWTDTAASNETLAMNCLDWYTAFAFCAWDGERLPTEAESTYAAGGGAEERGYPWGRMALADSTYAVYYPAATGVAAVGSHSPKGDGKWQQADLAGNVQEWALDWEIPLASTCYNCAVVSKGAATDRVLRGGGWNSGDPGIGSFARQGNGPSYRYSYYGARCAATR